MKSFFKLIIFTALVALGSYIGYQLALCRRPVDSSRMEKCLLLYTGENVGMA